VALDPVAGDRALAEDDREQEVPGHVAGDLLRLVRDPAAADCRLAVAPRWLGIRAPAAGRTALRLLDHVGQFVREQPSILDTLPFAEPDVLAVGEGARADPFRCPAVVRRVMNAHVLET